VDRGTYKSARRMIILRKLAELAEGVHGLRIIALEEADLAEMLLDSDNILDYTPEGDEDET